MLTLQDYRKRKFKRIGDFADAAHLTYNEVCWWLRANRPDLNPEPLYTLLGLSSDEYIDAFNVTREEEDTKWKSKTSSSLTRTAGC